MVANSTSVLWIIDNLWCCSSTM